MATATQLALRSWIAALLAATLSSGCGPTATATTPKAKAKVAVTKPLRPGAILQPEGNPDPGGTPTLKGGIIAPTGSPPLPVPDAGTPVVANHGGGVIANNGAALIGRVTLPSLIANNGGAVIANNGGAVIANNGGGLIANHGGGLISLRSGYAITNNGAGYRVLGTSDTPMAGVEVALLGADGRPAVDGEGKPIRTVTDAEGRYRIPFTGNTVNLIVQVALPTQGEMLALVPRGQSASERTVDIDLVSTLVLGYIIDQYVKGQTDRQGTLDKLPAEVEASTRAKAATALATGAVAVPDRLVRDTVITTVEGLRAKDPTFNGQMEAVKSLLVAAGQSDLGNGRLAKDVLLSFINDVVALPDGNVYLNCRADARIWRLQKDGRLSTAVGRNPTTPDDSLEGKVGAEASIRGAAAIAGDGQDGLLILEYNRLSRLSPDGKLTEVWRGKDARRVWATGGTTYVLTTVAGSRLGAKTFKAAKAALWSVAAGKAATLLKDFEPVTAGLLSEVVQAAPDGKGGVHLGLYERTLQDVVTNGRTRQVTVSKAQIHRLSLDDFTLARVTEGTTTTGVGVDGAGAIALQTKSTVAVGGTAPLTLPADSAVSNFRPIARTPGGQVLFTAQDILYSLEASGPKRLAGVIDMPRSGAAGEIAFRDPKAIAVTGAGEIYVYDDSNRWLWFIDAAGNARVYAELPDTGFPDPDGDAMVTPTALRVTAAGKIIMLDDEGRLTTVDGVGKLTMIFGPPPPVPEPEEADGDEEAEAEEDPFEDPPEVIPEVVKDFFPRADGKLTLLVERKEPDGSLLQLIDLAADGTRSAARTLTDPTDAPERLAVSSTGQIYVAANSGLFKVEPDNLLTLVATPEDWLENYSTDGGWFAADARGRFFHVSWEGIRVLDPVALTTQIVVGEGGTAFNGTGVDDSAGSWLFTPCLDAAGNLYFLDPERRQVKRVPLAELP